MKKTLGASGIKAADLIYLVDALEEPYKEYWSELGKFIHVFAGVENQLLSLLQQWSGLNAVIAPVFIDGTRTDKAKDTLNRILEETGNLKIKTRLERPLAQFAAINKTRNHLIHWGISLTTLPNKFKVSNPLLSQFSKYKELHITSAELRSMRADLAKINLSLLLEIIGVDIAHHPTWADDINKPWLYKPPQPSPQQKKLRPLRTPTTRKRPQVASPK
jgi:hypothetical protein